jgi:hypothetical protein
MMLSLVLIAILTGIVLAFIAQVRAWPEPQEGEAWSAYRARWVRWGEHLELIAVAAMALLAFVVVAIAIGTIVWLLS